MQRHKQKSEAERTGGGEIAGGKTAEERAARPRGGEPGRLKTAWAALTARLRRLLPGSGRVRRMESDHAKLWDQFEALSARVRQLENRERPAVPRPGEMALNLTSRTTALKLSRSGQNVRQIAQTLGVPAGEIELLLKVQQLQYPPAAQREARDAQRVALTGMAGGDCAAGAGRGEAKDRPRPELVR
jgi:hypothetical protein